MKTGSRSSLVANCYWIDAKPQAHWTDGSGKALNVELSDLLVDVTVSGAGLSSSRRAMLVQGKWTEDFDDLGAGACHTGADDSTNRERDLLEVHCGPVDLFASGKQVTPVPTSGANSFDVSKSEAGRILIEHARYLLFPQTKQTGEPYQALLPTSRNTVKVPAWFMRICLISWRSHHHFLRYPI